MVEHAVKVAGVVTRAVIPAEFVLGEELRMLTVLLGLVVLLAILDETSLPFVRVFVAFAFYAILPGLFGWPLV